MGSFNTGCGISNLAIEEGDDIGFVLLTKGTGNERRDPAVGVSTILYGNEFFRPYLPPVFGSYGDYGNIEAVESSKTVELLEAMFSLPIQDILKCVTCGDGLYDDGEILRNYFIGSKKFKKFGVSNEVALTELGFTKVQSGDSKEIYSLGGFDIAVRPQGMMFVWSIFRAGSEVAVVPEFISQFTSQVLDVFSQISGICPGYKEEDYKKIHTLKSLYGMFFLKDTFTGMKSHLEKNDYFFADRKESLEKMWNEFQAARIVMKNEEPATYKVIMPHLSLGNFVACSTGFPVDSIEELGVYGGSYDYLEIPALMSVMTSVNRMFLPSYCGTQDGDTDASMALNAITDAILSGRKA